MPVSPLFSLVLPVTPSNTSGALSQSNLPKNGALSPITAETAGSTDLSQGQSFFEQLQAATGLTSLPVGQEFAAYMPQLAEAQDASLSELNADFVGPLSPLSLVNSETTGDGSGILYGQINQATVSDTTQTDTPEGLQYLESLRRAQPHLQSQAGLGSHLEDDAEELDLNNNFETQSQAKIVQSELAARQQYNQEGAVKVLDPNLQAVNPAVSMNAQNNKMINLDELGMDVLTQEIALDEASLDGTNSDLLSIHEQPKTLTSLKESPLVTPPIAQDINSSPDVKLNGMDAIAMGLKEPSATKSMALDQGDTAKTQLAEKLPSNFNKLDVPPQNPQWNDQVAKRISIMASESVQSARIQLDPPELGSLEIKVKVQHDQVSVAFGSNNQTVRDALETQTPRLRELLEQQGVNLSDVNVSEQGREQHGQDSNDAFPDGGDHDSELAESGQIADQDIQTFESDSLVDYFA
ncbi:MAG: flagellar hook-length control protein FliK [Bermanella sp.]